MKCSADRTHHQPQPYSGAQESQRGLDRRFPDVNGLELGRFGGDRRAKAQPDDARDQNPSFTRLTHRRLPLLNACIR